MMDELGFRGTSSDSLSVSYTPAIKSPASRKATASRSNVSLSLSQPSRLPSPKGPPATSNLSTKPSRINGKALSTATPASSGRSGGVTRFRSLRNMLPFGPKQSSNGAAAASSASSSSSSSSLKPANPTMLTPPMQADLRHRRSSSSIPTSGMTPVPKGFLSVGRRTSMALAKERTLPALPSLPRSRSEDSGLQHSPVLSISRPSSTPSKINTTQDGLSLPEDPFKKSSPSIAVSGFFPHGSSQNFGTARPRGDLSTIIESELSHLSIFKQSPPPDPRKDDDNKAWKGGEEAYEDDNESDKQMLAQLVREESNNNNLSIVHGQDLDVTAATADLSASWEAGISDIRGSLQVPSDRKSRDGCTSPSSTHSVSPVSGPSSAQETTPPTSLPVTSKSEVQLNSPESEQDVDHPSFGLSMVDPDFAAMLSPKNHPNHIKDDSSARLAAVVDSVVPPPPMHSSPSPSPEPDEFGRRTSIDPDDARLPGSSSRRTSASSRKRTVGLQSSPVRRSRPSSLALSSDSLPLGERTRKTSIEKTPMNNRARRPLLSPTPRAESKSSRTSAEELTETIRRPTNARLPTALSKRTAANETIKHRAHVARLYTTPSRPSTSGSLQTGRVSSDSARSFVRSSHTREESISRAYSPISRPRPTTSLGVSSRTASGVVGADSLVRPATALSSIGRGPPPVLPRSRKRSLSTTTDIHHRSRNNIPDWMGPRTARAFAAAGLLDLDNNQQKERERNASLTPPRSESRMRMVGSRPSFDRDYRTPSESAGTSIASSSVYAPSRAGYSEHGTFPIAGRRRASSRTMTMAELTSARVESPVTSITSSSNARTVFSASTATSLSCSSPHQQYQVAQFESEIASLKEKHATEMEAILGALADSQRTSKTLREENSQLKGRIQDLEEQLADLAEQLEEARHQQPPPTQQYKPLLRRQHSPRESPRGSPSRMHTFVPSSSDYLASDDDTPDTQTIARDASQLLSPSFNGTTRPQTRASMASSVFPVLPSNMSMLLHDEDSETHPSPAGSALTSLQLNAYASSANSSSASPTLNVNRIVSSSATDADDKGKNRHATNLSLSSIEMSMISSLSGSPKSLKLKPEHEKHLCDLKSIDFSVIDSD